MWTFHIRHGPAEARTPYAGPMPEKNRVRATCEWAAGWALLLAGAAFVITYGDALWRRVVPLWPGGGTASEQRPASSSSSHGRWPGRRTAARDGWERLPGGPPGSGSSQPSRGSPRCAARLRSSRSSRAVTANYSAHSARTSRCGQRSTPRSGGPSSSGLSRAQSSWRRSEAGAADGGTRNRVPGHEPCGATFIEEISLPLTAEAMISEELPGRGKFPEEIPPAERRH